jgi:cytochrome c oxidase subunit IV
MKRPFGITLLAIIFAGAGLTYMMLGFQMTTAVTFGPLQTGQGTWLWGWLIVLTGLVFWVGGFATWRLMPWGWMLGQIVAIIGLVEAVFALLGTGSLNYALATTAFPLILLWYLNRDNVKRAFGLTDE